MTAGHAIVRPGQIIERVMEVGYTIGESSRDTPEEARSRTLARIRVALDDVLPEPSVERDKNLSAMLESAAQAVNECLDDDDPGRSALWIAADMMERRALNGTAQTLWDAMARVELLQKLADQDRDHGALPDDLGGVLRCVWTDFHSFGQREAQL